MDCCYIMLKYKDKDKMPFNYTIIPKLAKAEAVTQQQFQNAFCTLKKQHVSIKGHAADSYIPEIKFAYL